MSSDNLVPDRGPLMDLAYMRPGAAAASLMDAEEKLMEKGATSLKIEFRCEHEHDTALRIWYLRPENKEEKKRRLAQEKRDAVEVERRAKLEADPEYKEYQRLHAKFGDCL